MRSFHIFLQTIKIRRLGAGTLDVMFKTKVKELNKMHLM